MRPTEYDAMFQLEDNYWWFEGSIRFILSELGDIPAGLTGRVLDAGCGTGGLLWRLAHRQAWGVEIASEVADGPYSVILDQVSAGVAVRMAILFLMLGGQSS